MRAIDIDTELDLIAAEAVACHRGFAPVGSNEEK